MTTTENNENHHQKDSLTLGTMLIRRIKVWRACINSLKNFMLASNNTNRSKAREHKKPINHKHNQSVHVSKPAWTPGEGINNHPRPLKLARNAIILRSFGV